MQRLINDLGESPLRKLYSLESNLKRERSVFAIVIALLACVVLGIAAMSVVGLFQGTFRQEEQAARTHENNVTDILLQRRMMLTTASLVLQMHMSSALPASPVMPPNVCTPLFSHDTDNIILRESCNYSVQVLSNTAQTPSMAMVLADGSAAVGHLFPAEEARLLGATTPAGLAHAVLDRFRQRGVDPLYAARKQQILWIAVPSTSADGAARLMGASVVMAGDRVHAIVMTSIDVRNLVLPVERRGLVQQPVLIDVDGTALSETGRLDQIRKIDDALYARQDGLYHWVSGFGWALRRPPFFANVGHMLYLLPFSLQLRAVRLDLWLIGGMTLLLIVMLGVAFRYWNYKFLTRIYSEVSRALDSEILNHLLVHATPVGLCVVSRPSLEIVVANPLTRALLGLRIADRHLPAVLRDSFEKTLAESGGEGASDRIWQFTCALAAEGQPPVHVEVTGAPARLDNREVFFCAINDMTARYQAETLLREAKLTSEAAARAKVAFFASMSHEIRTPLASLVGNIELVARGQLAPEQRARVWAMQSSATGLLQVVNDVLDFSKIDVGELTLMEEWADPVDLLDRLALSYAPLARQQGLRFYTVFERNIPPRLRLDPIRLSQIVNNLLGNAVKFTPSGKIVLRVSWRDSQLEISVIDSGVGVTEELKRRLFQPFMQGDNHRLAKARGTGLGLSICARLCDLMKGQISLDSTVGVGTRITVRLPLEVSNARPAVQPGPLPYHRPLLLARAQENIERLSYLFDPALTVIAAAATCTDMTSASDHDLVIATDEISADEVQRCLGEAHAVLWATDDGPLVPRRRASEGVEVSIHSLTGLRAAAEMLARECTAAETNVLARADTESQTIALIAEDNVLNRSLLHDQLTTLGVRALVARNGEEALALVEKEHVDVVLTDIDMPVMDGYQLLGELRRRGMRLPVYAVSASARPEDIAEGYSRGFTDYLTKPVPLDKLEMLASTWKRNRADADVQEAKEYAMPEFPSVPISYAVAFLQQADRHVQQFEDILEGRALGHLRECLHSLAGGLAVLGPSELYEQCQELRLLARESDSWSEELELQSTAIRDQLRKMAEQVRARRPERNAV
ncbi:two-component system capsular synthesis sensor histidine kinase RcsC [Paraburkholderia silvatlantica]|uniref:Virulence sensor protein BvgS n=1 Tax=Paraburkholderia silvatlantica TaxID=321895 RepID=A0A2V4TNX9_9BURK|nr:hybrid sensor histidine kinase/response regulator [Paraburkholderia silvatlantica]PYE12259.1 two-component system capsular synthesis sensor histidine kinase RcsC [Paraburkholderia silvatlantica]